MKPVDLGADILWFRFSMKDRSVHLTSVPELGYPVKWIVLSYEIILNSSEGVVSLKIYELKRRANNIPPWPITNWLLRIVDLDFLNETFKDTTTFCKNMKKKNILLDPKQL